MRLIDADALEGRILMDAPGFMDGGSEITKAFILAMIKTKSVTPTVDAIPVVRCKDCMHSIKKGERYYCTAEYSSRIAFVPPDWYCPDGERAES